MSEDCCAVCLEGNKLFIIKNHNCKICRPCIREWVKQKIIFQDIDQIPCMIEGCHKYFLMTEVHQQLISDPLFQEVMFQNYIRKEKDIRPCPKQGCQGFAFIPEKPCRKELQCPTCNYQWIDRNYISESHLFQLMASQILNEIYTAIVEFRQTQQCPKCEASIQKDGGCSHMTCKKCNFYFCWLCKQNVTQHVNPQCASRSTILTLLILLYGSTLMHSVGILFLLGYLILPIIYFYYCVIFVMYYICLLIPIAAVALIICYAASSIFNKPSSNQKTPHPQQQGRYIIRNKKQIDQKQQNQKQFKPFKHIDKQKPIKGQQNMKQNFRR